MPHSDMERPQCSIRQCKHFHGITEIVTANGVPKGEAFQVPYCCAYPGGIPDRIAYGEDLHGVKAPDQCGDDVFEEGPKDWALEGGAQ